jgi:hypothetical protein
VALLATLLLEAATAAEERGDEQDHR